ncbi:hypothetical protein C6P88_33400 [Burkholderia contaminans]|uniref:Uncharacterized protein n=1 Tax=Burkholderia contaminans TaxID=488447 RepID=A0A2S5E835_9BURK|nr:hypothetical protein C3743_13760 [Burkholderia contaminans]PRD86410.1 hypothetical protein C6P88_33400 [Burkholderia contaminans]
MPRYRRAMRRPSPVRMKPRIVSAPVLTSVCRVRPNRRCDAGGFVPTIERHHHETRRWTTRPARSTSTSRSDS